MSKFTPDLLREEAALLAEMPDRGQLFCFSVDRIAQLLAHADTIIEHGELVAALEMLLAGIAKGDVDMTLFHDAKALLDSLDGDA